MMKNNSKVIVLILFLVFTLNFNVLADSSGYERVDVTLPGLSEPIAIIDNATGWTLTPYGEWISSENRIPCYLSQEYEILQDHDEYRLGIDNFRKLYLSTIKIQDIEYYIFIKEANAGHYSYPSIDEGWNSTVEVLYYVFKKNEINKFKYEKEIEVEPKLVRLKLIYSGGDNYLTKIPYKKLKEFISKDIQEKIIEKKENKENDYYYERYLLFNMLPFIEKNKIRFIFVEESKYKSKNSSYSSTDYSDLAGFYRTFHEDRENVINSDIFKKYYFECDLDLFNEMFPISKK
jgi:hypothetical protein